MTPDTRKGFLHDLWMQVPFLLWLVALWMLLWGQFTLLAAVSGLIVAVFVTRVFRLPTVELSGRINPWYLVTFVVRFLFAVLRGAVIVTFQVLDFRRQPGAAILAVPLRYADDLLMTHVAVTSSLIPGSLLIDTDRDRRVLYVHVIGARTHDDVEEQRAAVLEWERRIVRAVGSPAQYRALKADERAARSASAKSKDGGAR